MRLPPAFLTLRVQSDERRIRLWIPLLLLWPVFAVLVLLGAPLVVLAAAFYWHRGWGRPILLTGPLLVCVLISLRGLRVNVVSGVDRVFVSID